MGDRANIYLEMPKAYGQDAERSGVYLYTHWSGSEWPEKLREALEFGKGRWDDDPYLARIITSRVFADLVDSETGGGLSLVLTDNEYPITVVDLSNQTVSFAPLGGETDSNQRVAVKSFADFVAQSRADYPAELQD
jgi:hypothetical protein